MVTLSMEFMQDRPDLASEVASLIAEAKDTEEEAIFSTGVGDALGTTFNPIGMFAAHGTSGAFTHVQSAGSQAFAIGDLYTVEAGLPIRHRMNAAWFMGRAEIRTIQAVETSGGQLFGGQYYNSVGYPANSPVGNTGLRLLTYPIYEVPSAPTGAAANAIVMALGDPKSFGIVERVGMQIEVIPHLFGAAQGNLPTGNRGIYAVWRNTAKPFNVDGMRTLADPGVTTLSPAAGDPLPPPGEPEGATDGAGSRAGRRVRGPRLLRRRDRRSPGRVPPRAADPPRRPGPQEASGQLPAPRLPPSGQAARPPGRRVRDRGPG